MLWTPLIQTISFFAFIGFKLMKNFMYHVDMVDVMLSSCGLIMYVSSTICTHDNSRSSTHAYYSLIGYGRNRVCHKRLGNVLARNRTKVHVLCACV